MRVTVLLRRWRRIVCLACFAAGGGLLLVGLGFAAYTWALVHRSVRVSGTIVSLAPVGDAQDGTSRAPVFRFAAADGRVFTKTSGMASGAFAVGQTVPVLYEAGHPEDARLDIFWQLWFLPVIFGVIGGVQILVGGCLWIGGRRSRGLLRERFR